MTGSWMGRLALGLSIAVGAISGVAAQDAPREPVIIVGMQDIDLAKYEWLNENVRKGIQGLIDAKKAGTIDTFVVAASPAGTNPAMRFVEKSAGPVNLPEMARGALQWCEHLTDRACVIVTVNGKEAVDATGKLPPQPRQLIRPSPTIDVNFVPFITREDQQKLRPYISNTGARAMAVTPLGGATWRGGDTVFAAVANVLADCQKNFPNQACILFAVNDRVVYAPGGPF